MLVNSNELLSEVSETAAALDLERGIGSVCVILRMRWHRIAWQQHSYLQAPRRTKPIPKRKAI